MSDAPPEQEVHFFKIKSVAPGLKFSSPSANKIRLPYDTRTAWLVDNNNVERQSQYVRTAVAWLHANCKGQFDYRAESTYLWLPTTKLHPQQPDHYMAHAIRHFVRFEELADALRFKLTC